jgi:hypothetical protein
MSLDNCIHLSSPPISVHDILKEDIHVIRERNLIYSFCLVFI